MSNDVHSLDFEALDPDDLKKIINGVAIVASYIIQKKDFDESIKDTLESLCIEVKAEKKAGSELKKYVRKAASVWARNKVDDIRYENEIVEMLLDSVNKHSVEEDE